MQKPSFHPIDSLLNGHFDEEGGRNSFLEARQAFLQQAARSKPKPTLGTVLISLRVFVRRLFVSLLAFHVHFSICQ